MCWICVAVCHFQGTQLTRHALCGFVHSGLYFRAVLINSRYTHLKHVQNLAVWKHWHGLAPFAQCGFALMQVVSFNGDMTEFTVTSSQVSEVENILRQVTYVNARSYPTPGRRNLRLDTTVTWVLLQTFVCAVIERKAGCVCSRSLFLLCVCFL